MKLKLTILALLVSLSVSANPAAAFACFLFSGTWTPAVNFVHDFNDECIQHTWERNGTLIYGSFDPVVHFDQDVTDIRMNGAIRLGKWNPYISYQHAFSPMDVIEYSAGIRYRFAHWNGGYKWAGYLRDIPGDFLFLGGVEAGRRRNEGHRNVWFQGVDFQIEWLPDKYDIGLFVNMGAENRFELSNPKFDPPYPFRWSRGNSFIYTGIYIFMQ